MFLPLDIALLVGIEGREHKKGTKTMSVIKRLLGELQEDLLGVKELSNQQARIATAYLNNKAGLVDDEWEEHRIAHAMHSSMNCHYCVDNADIPEEEVEE